MLLVMAEEMVAFTVMPVRRAETGTEFPISFKIIVLLLTMSLTVWSGCMMFVRSAYVTETKVVLRSVEISSIIPLEILITGGISHLYLFSNNIFKWIEVRSGGTV